MSGELVLAHPAALLLLVAPLLLRRVLPAYHVKGQALRVPWFERVASLSGQAPARAGAVVRMSRWQAALLLLLWGLLVLALARPQLLEPPLEKSVPTRDLLLLVDLSGSMETEDFTNAAGERADRLRAVKEVLGDFLADRDGDRVGLVVFGTAAFVQVPFTQDLAATRLLLEEAQVRMAGPRTAFGDAIGLAITLFERSELEERVVIALTDGNDTGSRIPPAEAARIARDSDITIHVVGVGDPTAVGEELLDEQALRAVAQTTGGRYFHAEDRDALQQVYAELDRIDVREVETLRHQPRVELYHWPLGAFLVLTLLLAPLPGRGDRPGREKADG